MKEYLVIFEWAGSNYSAYVPDLPGCVSTGKTLDDAEETSEKPSASTLARCAPTTRPSRSQARRRDLLP